MKSKIYLSTLALIIFSFLAGGSIDDKDVGRFFLIFIVIVIIGAMIAMVSNSIQKNNREKREQMIKDDEQNSTDFDRSVSIGDDRCKIYFDASKKKAMIMRVMTEGITKKYVDDFEFPGKKLAIQRNGVFYVYEPKSRKLLTVTYSDSNIINDVIYIGNHDKNNGITTKEPIEPLFYTFSTNHYGLTSKDSRNFLFILEEYHGMIFTIEGRKLTSSIKYISENRLPTKTGTKPTISTKQAGNYMFFMDNFFKVLVVRGEIISEIINYSDIIEVSYIENGTQLFTKSTGRTVGGAVVGGLLMGGAGAVVGGLSGDTKQDKEVKSMDIKILLRSTEKSSIVLNFMDSSSPLKTKESSDKELYEKFIKNANKAKDLLSIIIDDAKQAAAHVTSIATPAITPQASSVADELAKLAKLKADGILTEEEFQTQKAKLIG